jgi:hypothetical protein
MMTMQRILMASMVLFVLAAGMTFAQDGPAATPAKPTETKPAVPVAPPVKAPALTVEPAALAILNRLEKAGDTYKVLEADLIYSVDSRLTGDRETRTGTVAFQQGVEAKPAAKPGETPTKKTPAQSAKFRVSFTTLQLGKGAATKNRVDYLFDGAWLIVAKHKIKSMTRIQIAAKGQTVEALKIGKGPFPVPFGQKAADIVKLFEATAKPPRVQPKDAPKNTDYIKLVPRRGEGKNVNFTRMEMWVDRKTDLPVKIVTKDANKNKTSVTFSKVKTKPTFQPDLFTMKRPAGWDLTIEGTKK